MKRTLLRSAAICLAALAPVAIAQTVPQPAPQPAPAAGLRWEKTIPVIASGDWTGPRLPDGQPDVGGFW